MPKKKTHEEFIKEVAEKLGSDYIVLGQYTQAHGKILMKHSKCNKTFEKNIHDIVTKSSGCPYCNGSKPSLYNEQWVKDNTPYPYSYVSGYINMKSKCNFYCDICHSEFMQLPARLINQHLYGCNCQKTKKLTHEMFLERLGPECLQEYEVLEEYTTTDKPITFKHKQCGAIFKISPYSFVFKNNKKYCPICYYKKSHGEVLITNFLIKNNITYKKEYIFQDFPKRKFDYYLQDFNTIIEFDGRQHYEFISFFHKTLENFQYRQQIDKDKNNYCLKNNITLYRIPYWEEKNLEEILTQILLEKSSTTIEKFIIKK